MSDDSVEMVGDDLRRTTSDTHNIIKYTKNGTPYIYDPTISDPSREHEREQLPINVSLREIEQRYGAGTRLYFSFLKYIMVSNFVLAGVGVASWIVFMKDPLRKNAGTIEFEDLFVGAYLPEHSRAWFGSGVASFSLWFFVGFCYFIWEHFIFKKLKTHDNIFAMEEHDEIEENVNVSQRHLITLRFISYAIVSISIIVCGAILYGFIRLQNEVQENDPIFTISISLIMSTVVSFALVIMNAAWNPISRMLTKFERHRSWSNFRTNHAFKLILFKILLATALYLMLALALNPINGATQSCLMQDAGTKFLLILLMDITLGNLIEIVGPVVKRKLVARFPKLRGEGSDEEEKPDFDIAEEYLQVLYRQFILYTGTLVFPILGLLGLIANFIEYPLDKFRMLRMCQEPKRVDQTMGSFLLGFMIFVGVTAALTYPNGPVWMLFAYETMPLGYRNCTMWGAITRL